MTRKSIPHPLPSRAKSSPRTRRAPSAALHYPATVKVLAKKAGALLASLRHVSC